MCQYLGFQSGLGLVFVLAWFSFQMSVPIMTAFGKDTEVAAWIVNFLLSKVESNVKHCVAEPNLIKDTVDLLAALVEPKDKWVHSLF